MLIEFKDPPAAILASGSKEGVDLGGQKCLVSVNSNHNFFNEGNIVTELSWGEFYKEEGLEDQIDTFTTVEYRSVREHPEDLSKTIALCLDNIVKNQRVFYGIADFEVDAFMNQNCVIPGLKLDYSVINQLLDAHRKTRDENLFPNIIADEKGRNTIQVEFQGANKKKLHLIASKIESFADDLRLSRGFATGIVCTSKGAANLYIMSDNIQFKEEKVPEMYIDQENIDIIMMAIEREVLAPISWFRIDIGLNSLKTLELWDEIKDRPELRTAMDNYEKFITSLVYKKYKRIASSEKIGYSEDDFYNMPPRERAKALRDMADAIRKLTDLYKE